MKVLVLLLMVAACVQTAKQEAIPVPIIVEPVPEAPQPDLTTPKKRPMTIITVNPPAKPVPLCVPLAVNEKKRIIQALDCLIEDSPKP